MRLIQYLEKEEGFSVVIDERFRKRLSQEFPTKANGEKAAVLHRSTGQLRLRVPQVRFDENYAERLRERISSLAGITGRGSIAFPRRYGRSRSRLLGDEESRTRIRTRD